MQSVPLVFLLGLMGFIVVDVVRVRAILQVVKGGPSAFLCRAVSTTPRSRMTTNPTT
jgi:hypothetical protein